MLQKGFAQVFVLLILFMGLAASAYLVQHQQIFKPRAQSPRVSFESLVSQQNLTQEYGFNTHLTSGNYGYYENLNLATFKNSVDELAARNVKWIRFLISSGEIAPSGNTTSINWNQANLAAFDEAINYANLKGVKVFLVTDVPFFAQNYPLTDYISVSNVYYSFLADRYRGKINIWQIFNEADTHRYNNYQTIDGTLPLDSQYLADLNQIVTAIKNTIRAQDTAPLITMNVSGYPLSAVERTYNRWVQFYDVLGDKLDVLSLDMYPDGDPNANSLLTQRVNDIYNRYGKSVTVAEIGMCTNRFSESDQASYVSGYIESLKNSQAKLVLIYEYMDEGGGNNCEETFGVKGVNRTKKLAYESVMQAFSVAPTPTPASTVPPVPTAAPSFCFPCSADVNKDGLVNSRDYSRVSRCYGKKVKGRNICVAADINKDGVVNETDGQCIQSMYGKTCSEATPTPAQGVFYCDLDLKLCPDGSYVGRTGPNCEFTPCS